MQHFRQLWLWVLILAAVVPFWFGAISQLCLGRPFGSNPMSNLGLVLAWVVFGMGLPGFLLSLRLTTEVRPDGVYYQFSPIHLAFRRLAFEDLKHWCVREYRPIREYGGWGLRYGGKGCGWAYTVSGCRGVQFELANGRRVLLGSQRADEFGKAMEGTAGVTSQAGG
ncbi:MAG: hypothetical protein HYU36_15130 [Planctomycetes bacterium]|nr:hypothetical protein [Planctomycetota bacterium]